MLLCLKILWSNSLIEKILFKSECLKPNRHIPGRSNLKMFSWWIKCHFSRFSLLYNNSPQMENWLFFQLNLSEMTNSRLNNCLKLWQLIEKLYSLVATRYSYKSIETSCLNTQSVTVVDFVKKKLRISFYYSLLLS